ncbi:MAG: TetR/AcrR family transcriptional regulator [Fusobacteriaceae bacterium]
MNTKQKIINSAIDLFYEIPYGEVSLLQICKNAEVSNGILYKYFKNKEDLFKFLLETISERIENKLKYISGKTIEEKLKSYIQLNIDITLEEKKLIKIFREGQYRFPLYEKRIQKAYLKNLEEIFKRKLDESEIIYILGSIRFINISYSSRDISYDIDFFIKILFEGFVKTSINDLNKIYDKIIYKRTILNNDNLKYKFIETGEELFGQKEYNDVKIKDITSTLNCSIGMFYNFFESKEKFFNEIIEKLKNEVIFLIKDNFDENLDVGTLHIIYLYSFSKFYKNKSFKYKLLRDAEFINFKTYKNYLVEIENFYMHTLKNNSFSEDENRIISNILLGIQHYMGIELFFTKDILNFNNFLYKINIMFVNGIKKLD